MNEEYYYMQQDCFEESVYTNVFTDVYNISELELNAYYDTEDESIETQNCECAKNTERET